MNEAIETAKEKEKLKLKALEQAVEIKKAEATKVDKKVQEMEKEVDDVYQRTTDHKKIVQEKEDAQRKMSEEISSLIYKSVRN
jgi:hypothetical protein